MPLKHCSCNGKPGWKWGDKGKCYCDESSEANKKKAIKQGLAEGGGKLEESEVQLAETWSDAARKAALESRRAHAKGLSEEANSASHAAAKDGRLPVHAHAESKHKAAAKAHYSLAHESTGDHKKYHKSMGDHHTAKASFHVAAQRDRKSQLGESMKTPAVVASEKPRKLTCLVEDSFAGTPQVDTEKGVFRNVKILGQKSRNGREYTPQAMAEAAKLYEGMGVNLSHLGKDDAGADLHGNAPVERGFGWLENISIKPDGVYGDMAYLKTHPQAEMIVEAAQRNPNRFGLSHHAYGRASKKNGKVVVESTHSVKSVDIVQNPATTSGFFESEDRDIQETPVKTTLKKFCESIDAKNAVRPELLKLLEMDEMAAAGDYPMDEPSEPDADDMAVEAVVALVRAALKDNDPEKAVAAVKALSKIISPEAPAEAGASDAGGGGSSDEEKAAESAALKAKEDAATELLEAAGIKVESAKVKALAALHGSSADRKALVESWRPAAAPPRAGKPARSAPLVESTKTEKYPADAKSFAAAIAAR